MKIGDNKLEKTFAALRAKGEKAFVGFVTAGDPDMESTRKFVCAMDGAGADVIEIGVPFSDPIAEGEVIQRANVRAQKNRVTMRDVLRLTGGMNTRAPLVLLTYLNPVFSYGYEKFFADAAAANVSGIIIPDCPFEERGEFYDIAQGAGVIPITMIAPTSEQRINTVASAARGFIYLVSSMGVTGVRQTIGTDIGAIARRIRKVTDTPICVGFGISTPEQAANTARLTDGAIVGSAIVRLCEQYGSSAERHIADYVRSMKQAVLSAKV